MGKSRYFSDLRLIVVCSDGLDCRTTWSEKALPKVYLQCGASTFEWGCDLNDIAPL